MCLYFGKKVYEKSKVAPAPQIGNFGPRNNSQPQQNQPTKTQKNSSDHQQIPMTSISKSHQEKPSQTLNTSPVMGTCSKLDQNTPNLILVREYETNIDTEMKGDTEERNEKDIKQTKNGDCNGDKSIREKQTKPAEEIATGTQNNFPFQNINVEHMVPTCQPFPVAVQIGKKALNVNLLSICQICVFLPLSMIPTILSYFPDEDCHDANIMFRLVRLLSLITIVGLIVFPILSEKKLDNF